jgi:hypothetical protein
MLDKVYLRNGEYAMMWVFKEILNIVKEKGGKLAHQQYYQQDNHFDGEQLIIRNEDQAKMTVKGFTWSFGSYIVFELNGYYYYLQSGSNPLIDNAFMKTKIIHKDGKDWIQSVYLDDLDDVCNPTLNVIRYAGGKPFYADVRKIAQDLLNKMIDSKCSGVAEKRIFTVVYKEIED